MELHWSVKLGGLVWLFTGLKFAVTAYFGADVDAHRAAYLTGVLAVFAFAALAATVDVWQQRKERGWRKSLRVPPLFVFALAVFSASLAWVVWNRPVGAAIASAFIGLVLVVSIVSRAWRSTELRFDGFDFADKESELDFWVVAIALIASWFVAVVFTPYLGVKLLPDFTKARRLASRPARDLRDAPLQCAAPGDRLVRAPPHRRRASRRSASSPPPWSASAACSSSSSRCRNGPSCSSRCACPRAPRSA